MSADEWPDDDGMSPETQPEGGDPPGVGDATMRIVLLWVPGSAAVMTAVALLFFSVRVVLGIALGGAIATANLYVFARIGDAFISRRGRTSSWTLIAIVKLVALIGAVWLILKNDTVPSLALAVGYSSLVVGITLGTLFAPKPPNDGNTTPGDRG